jgi:hypothetical protein
MKYKKELNYPALKMQGLFERMKFFSSPVSNRYSEYLAHPCDVRDTPERSRQLYFLYSRHHNRHPKSVGPNSASSRRETPTATYERYDLSTFSQVRLCSRTEDTLHAYEHGLYSLRLSGYEHSLRYIFGSTNHDSEPVHHPLRHGNDTWLSIPNGHSNDLLYGSFSEYFPYSKDRKFIETKSIRNEIAGF